MHVNHRRIVATAPIGKVAIDILERLAPVETASAPNEEVLMGMLEGTIALVCRGEGRVTERMINACPTLRVIGRPGAGYDAVDVSAATARKIPVIYAPVGGFAVAEGALAMLLALVKKIQWCDQVVKSGQWRRRYETLSGDMAGHTLGVIGLGRIGAQFAKLTQPFEMTTLGYDPIISASAAGLPWVEDVSLPHLLGRSDFVSLHVPMNSQTRGMINRQTLALMKKGAILINTARGGIVESLDVLAEALAGGHLGGLGLDVFPSEPPESSHPIFRDARVLCAPHLVGVSKLAMEQIFRSMARDMVSVLKGGQPQYCVNPEVLR